MRATPWCRCDHRVHDATARRARERTGESPARASNSLSPCARAANADEELSNLPRIDVQFEGFNSPEIPSTPGIYAIYNDKNELQYIGLSVKYPRRLRCTALSYRRSAVSRRFCPCSEATKADFARRWKRWVMQHVSESGGSLPPGNTPKNELWADRKKRGPQKPSLRLTDGMSPDMSLGDAMKPKIQEAIDTHNCGVH